jgi:hypothetical protein
MVLETRIIRASVKKVKSLDGSVEIGADGQDTYDADGNNMLHSGYDPSGGAGRTAIALEGQDALENL